MSDFDFDFDFDQRAALARCEADWLREPDHDDVDLTAAEAADQLAAVEDAGGVLYEPSPGEFRVAAGAVLLGGGESAEDAVAAAFAALLRAGGR